MSDKIKAHTFLKLRREAERFLATNAEDSAGAANSRQEIETLLHEIQVQQIELEMQNDELRLANNELELQRSKFAGLFDLAPVGYFILDAFGVIKEVNNTGSQMLQLPINKITGKKFEIFLARGELELFTNFLEAIQVDEIRDSSPLTMIRRGQKFYAQVAGIVPPENSPENIRCYIAVIDITDRKKAELEHEKQILAATIHTQENERKRISEALHDSVGQLLYGIKLKLDQQSVSAELVKDLHKLLDQAIAETRNISFELAPSILKDFGLPVTVDEMAKRLCTRYLSIQVDISLRKRLELNTEITIFRVIQELVNNSIKHAEATKIVITVRKENAIVIEVSDNGLGFDPKSRKASAGSGLSAIRNRISLYGGEMYIDSAPGRGHCTIVTLTETEKTD